MRNFDVHQQPIVHPEEARQARAEQLEIYRNEIAALQEAYAIALAQWYVSHSPQLADHLRQIRSQLSHVIREQAQIRRTLPQIIHEHAQHEPTDMATDTADAATDAPPVQEAPTRTLRIIK
jgi:transposase